MLLPQDLECPELRSMKSKLASACVSKTNNQANPNKIDNIDILIIDITNKKTRVKASLTEAKEHCQEHRAEDWNSRFGLPNTKDSCKTK